MTSTTTITSQTPVQIDDRLYELYELEARALARVEIQWDRVHYAAGDRKRYVGRAHVWGMTDAKALAAARAVAADGSDAWKCRDAERALEGLAEAQAQVSRIRETAAPLNAEYTRRGGWTRAFLVANGDGHVHRSMGCSTCNRGQSATQFQWMTAYSGKTEAEIVAAAGWRACTICYPSAPVGTPATLPSAMIGKAEQAKADAKAARDAAKADREAKAKAAAPTASGEPLRINGEVFKTERAALIWASEQVSWALYRVKHHGGIYATPEGVRVVAESLAEKHGRPARDIWTEIEIKGRKKADQWQ